MSIRLTIMPGLIAGLLAAAPVMAQTTPAPATLSPTPAPTAKATPATASAATPVKTRRDMMVERRITELHSKLKITPAEQKPFDDFAQAMRDNSSQMDDLMVQHQTAAATATAPDQMKAYADIAQAHAQQVANLVAPFATLYSALSPEQKKLADQSFRQMANAPRGARAPTRS